MGHYVNPEILKLLNPRSARLDGLNGGIPELTNDDINAACAGADSLGLDILLARICADKTAQHRAFYSLYQEVIQLAVDRQWRIREKGDEKLRGLTQLAIFELTDSHRCPKCKGTGYNKRLRPCRSCGGTGFYNVRPIQRAKALGIAASTWQRVWAYRFADVMALMATHEASALKVIGCKLKRGLS